jgi:hypothetical protein
MATKFAKTFNFKIMANTNVFKTLLLVQTIGLLSYTFIAFQTEGASLLSVFLTNIKSLTWTGQFNLDFMFMLTLSALWTAWRHSFSGIGIVLSCIALFGGSLFLAAYLIVLSWQTKGDMKRVLLGDARAA